MSSDTGRVISFSIETTEKKDEITKYAKEHGFKNAADLARFATYQYMKRYKPKSRKTCTAAQVGGMLNHDGGKENGSNRPA